MLISIIVILLLVIFIGYSAISTIVNEKHLNEQTNDKKKYKKKTNVFDTQDRNHTDGGDN